MTSAVKLITAMCLSLVLNLLLQATMEHFRAKRYVEEHFGPHERFRRTTHSKELCLKQLQCKWIS